MSSLGKIILKIFKTYHPHTNLNLTNQEIDSILEQANINKSNYQKSDISKIIKILKHHVEINTPKPSQNIGQLPDFKNQTSMPNVFPEKNNISLDINKPKNFTDLEKDNLNLSHMTQSYLDNLDKIREKDLNFTMPKQDIAPPELRIKEFMEEKKMEFEHYVLIDSKDRNINVDTNPSEYTIKFGISDREVKGSIVRNFEEVISIELIDVMIKHTQGSAYTNSTDKVSIPPYLILEIEEIGGNMEGTNNNINKGFGRLTYFEIVGSDNNDKTLNTLYRHYIIPRGNIIKYFKPRKNITRLTIRIRNFTGELYNFGDAVDDETNSCNSFTFCIKTLQKNFITNFIDKTN